ncbi:MAG TPA: RsmG family class I SAM-dependent methyltransferase, partial [Actinomycetota bacterium]
GGAAREKLREFGELLRGQAATWGLIGFGPDAVDEQIERSLLLLEVLGRPERLVDVGSGAGLPGIPLMIAVGNGVLVEPRRKAAAFLEGAIRRLDLPGSVFVGTAEDAGRGSLREWGDAVVARAVGSPAVAAELCSPLCAPGGMVLLTASPEAVPSDLLEGPRRALGLGPLEIRSIGPRGPTGPTEAVLGRNSGEIQQRVLMMKKVAPTPSEFPRRPGTARRRPMGS